MHHHFIDYYAQADSIIHRLDARTKMLIALAYTIALISINKYQLAQFIPMTILPFAWITLAGIPWKFVFKQILISSPFIITVIIFTPLFDKSTHNITLFNTTYSIPGGYIVAANLLLKYLLGITTLVGLASTTRFEQILLALRKFHLPEILTIQLAFLYRYLFELIEQAHQMLRARNARTVGSLPISAKIKSARTILATLFIRSYEASKQIFLAMQARGYNGQIKTFRQLNFKPADIFAIITVSLYLYLCISTR